MELTQTEVKLIKRELEGKVDNLETARELRAVIKKLEAQHESALAIVAPAEKAWKDALGEVFKATQLLRGANNDARAAKAEFLKHRNAADYLLDRIRLSSQTAEKLEGLLNGNH